ncbi:MAG: TonB-dependent receptor [Burkholderiaceae bacterium]
MAKRTKRLRTSIEDACPKWPLRLAAARVSIVVNAIGALTITIATHARADDVQPLKAVEVIGNYDNGIGTSDAASQGSVNAKLIENRPVLRTGEILEFVPGLIVSQHSGDGKANQYYLRGFNLDHGTDFATFVDGMPINMRTHAHGQGYTDLNFLSPELVSRIDYKKGTYYADEGDFASAGAAHLRLIDKLDRGIASVAAGEHGYTRGFIANSNALGAGNLLYAVDAGYNNGPWDNPEHARRTSGILRYSQGDPGDGFSITAMGYDAKWTSTDQIPQRAVDSGLIDRFGAIDPTDGGKTSRYSISFDAVKPNAFGLLRFNGYAVASRLNLYNDFTYVLDDPVNGDQFEQIENRRIYGFDLSQSFANRIGGFDTETTVGLQTRYDRLDPVALYHDVARERIATTRTDRVKEASAGLYAENKIRWNDWFRSIVGARYDAYHFDVASNLEANSGKVSDHITSPKLSLIFGPWAKTELFANYGQGFHSNDARGVTSTVSPADGSPIDRAVPLVKTRGEEVGARTAIVPGLQSSLALWRLTLASELVFSGDAGDTEISRASRRQGIEFNNHYIALPWLLFDLDLALSHSHYTQDDPVGNYIPGSIEKVASFGVSVLDRGPWFGHFQLRYFGPRPLIENDSVRSRSTTLASARVGYTIDRNVRVMVDVFNLFDRKASDIDYYYTSRLPGEPTGGVDDIHFHPVEPRTARVSIVARF